MTTAHKTSDVREKELRLALLKVGLGRAGTGETRITIAAVAREAGVSSALIHNHYPDIAEAIRVAQGRSSRAQRDAKQEVITSEREKNRALREEVKALNEKISMLASINEMLLTENRVLKAKQNDRNVIDFS